jgi:hypothetical protein
VTGAAIAEESERPRLEDEEEVPVISVEAEERMEEVTRVEKEAQQEQEVDDQEAFTVSSGSRYKDDFHLPCLLRGLPVVITGQFHDTVEIDRERFLGWGCTRT